MNNLVKNYENIIKINELYFYNELKNIDDEFGQIFLLNICLSKINKSDISYYELCDILFTKKINSSVLSCSRSSSQCSSRSSSPLRLYSNGSQSPLSPTKRTSQSPTRTETRSESNGNRRSTLVPLSPLSPRSPLSVIATRSSCSSIKNNSSDSSGSTTYNTILTEDISNNYPGNNSPENDKLKPKKISINDLVEDCNNYKHLLYTDSSYIVPKHIEKLLEVLQDQ